MKLMRAVASYGIFPMFLILIIISMNIVLCTKPVPTCGMGEGGGVDGCFTTHFDSALQGRDPAF